MFINYRNEDSNSYGALLYLNLSGHFGTDMVFLDAESIPAGTEFTSELLRRVRSANVLLAVIGRHWLLADPVTGRRRIDDPDDWVRREIAEAFASGVRVIPVLTDQAQLPRETDLPDDIAELSRCQYRDLRRRQPTADLARIVADLTSLEPTLAAAARKTANASATTLAPQTEEYLRLLARASWKQWTAAANDRRLVHPAPLPIRWRRSDALVAGPPSATTYARLNPLPGPVDAELAAGDQAALHRVYGGLPSGRLLLIGPPGSGKTSAAILLLLDALRHRKDAAPDDQARIPVPVLFTLHGWNPGNGESAVAWMAGKLAETYPMFRGRAGRQAAQDLLTDGHIAVFLDGLDEVPEAVRPGALNALADAPFRLVLLSRTDEAIAVAKQGPLLGAVAVELQPVTPTDAVNYLLEPLVDPPPEPWQAIRDHLTESTAVAEALSTPLTLGLLRDVYGSDGQVDELLDTTRFSDAADIENHLLDHAISAAYTPRPGNPNPPCTVAAAQNALRYIATQLTKRKTTDLAWWHIPTWTSHRWRMVKLAVATSLMSQVAYSLPIALAIGPVIGIPVGLMFGLSISIAGVAGQWQGVPVMPRRIALAGLRGGEHSLLIGSLSGLGGVLLAGISAWAVSGISAGLVSGLSIGLAAGLVAVVVNGLLNHTTVDDRSLEPANVWRNDVNAGFVALPVTVILVGVLAILTVTAVPGLAAGLEARLPLMFAGLLSIGLVQALAMTATIRRIGAAGTSPGTASIDTAMATAQLAIQGRIPVRLMAFLEDAKGRNLLRTVGPVYQFRHARLQERLAQS